MPKTTSLVSWSAGNGLTAAKLNANTVNAFADMVSNKAICHLTNTQSQSAASSTVFTQMTLNSAVVDTDGMADLVNSRAIVQTAGLYRVTAQTSYLSTSVAGSRGTGVRVDGATYPCMSVGAAATSGITSRCSASGFHRLNAGQAVYLFGFQNSGSNLNTATDYGGCSLWLEWVAA